MIIEIFFFALLSYILFLGVSFFKQITSSPLFLPLEGSRNNLDKHPKVSIIVPVRNSEATIAKCVDSLLNLEYPNKEILVVDGNSTDGTRSILRSYRDKVKVLDESNMPEGWIGKCRACHQGYLHSDGEYLLFTDADTVHSPSSLLASLSRLVRDKIALLSLSPRVNLSAPSEKALLPPIFLIFQDVARRLRVNEDSSKIAWAIGEYLLVSRECYEKIGGHKDVWNKIDEDVRIATNARRLGLKVRLMDGSEFVSMTMYDSISDIWSGLVRNFYGIASRSWMNFGGVLALMFVYFVLPFVILTFGLVGLIFEPQAIFILVLGASASTLAFAKIAFYARQLSSGMRYSLLLPISSIILFAMLLNSMIRSLTGIGVSWRGRVYK